MFSLSLKHHEDPWVVAMVVGEAVILNQKDYCQTNVELSAKKFSRIADEELELMLINGIKAKVYRSCQLKSKENYAL